MSDILTLPISTEARLLFIAFQYLKVKTIEDQKDIADTLEISLSTYFKAYRELNDLKYVVLQEDRKMEFLIVGSMKTTALETWEKHKRVLRNRTFK